MPGALLQFITIPAADAAFHEAVARVIDQTNVPALIQERVREQYPEARVTPRELSSERPTVYVYRDGNYVAGRR